jgi:hypothetical protein
MNSFKADVMRRRTRSGDTGQPPGRGSCRCVWVADDCGRRPDAARHNIPHCFDDQAGDGCGGDDTGGRVQGKRTTNPGRISGVLETSEPESYRQLD